MWDMKRRNFLKIAICALVAPFVIERVVSDDMAKRYGYPNSFEKFHEIPDTSLNDRVMVVDHNNRVVECMTSERMTDEDREKVKKYLRNKWGIV